jgi:hypothetical protein
MPSDDEEYENEEEESEEGEGSESEQSNATGKDSVNAEATVPYLAALSQSYSGSINYTKLKAARVSAIMFYGGELYNNAHSKKTYVNPNLHSLVKQCNEHGMPFGLYVNVRAKSEIEADAECRALYYVLAHYPPILGVWLCIKTNNLRSMNDRILEVYYKFIDKWGLRERCGLYLEEHQLADITWSSFQDRFYLWLIKPMNVSEIDDELLDPVMFEVPE